MSEQDEGYTELCKLCKGTGLEPCEENHNISAKNHEQYVICTKCKGEGKP